MTDSTTSVEMRDGGVPWPPIEGATVVTIAPATLPMTPELRLCYAVLEQALSDLDRMRQRPGRRGAAKAAEVTRWFRSTDASWPFTFESICATIGIDSGAVRRSVFRTSLPAPRPGFVLASEQRLSA